MAVGSPVAVGVAVALSLVASHYAEKVLSSHDDSRIIIDEWVGAWVALWGMEQVIGGPLIVAFILFRIFDVWKGPWGRFLQKLPGGWGINLDDVGAGLLANLGTRALMYFIPAMGVV